MIEVLTSPPHVVALRISGRLTADDITVAYDATDAALRDHEHISFFAEVVQPVDFTVESIARDLMEGLRHRQQLSRYARAALVTDIGWMATLARVEGVAFSKIDVQVFTPEDRDEAFAWAASTAAPMAATTADTSSAFQVIPTTSDDVFAFEFDGRLTDHDVKTAVAAARPYLERDEKVNVLAVMREFGGVDMSALLNDDLIRMKLTAPKKIRRYAIVGATPWLRNLMELMDPHLSTEIRTFEPAEEAAAWEWVGATRIP